MILVAMTSLERPWDDLHHRSYFLPKITRVEVGEFTSTMNGDVTHPVNPLVTHRVYAEGNMVNIYEMIPIDISKTPNASLKTSSSEQIVPLRIFKCILSYLRNFATFFVGLMRKCQELTLVFLNMKLETYPDAKLVR
jgi:hypothetical protein